MERDKSEIANIGPLLSKLGVALDTYVKFEHGDAFLTRQEWEQPLREEMPLKGVGAEKVVELLCEKVIPHASPIPKPGFTGFITCGATTIGSLALLAGAVAAPQRDLIQAFNTIEDVSLNWLRDMCGLPKSMKGIYSSGGSTANLLALGAARQVAFEAVGIDASADGVGRASRIYASDQTHHTIQRSAGVLGLGRNSVRAIPTDDRGRMVPRELKKAIVEDMAAGVLPVAVVANCGTTNTGSIDDLDVIGKIAKSNGIWFHVDGAYGLPGYLDERLRPLYEGLKHCDSAIVDPHKWLGAPVGIAATFVRDRDILTRTFMMEPADYLTETDEPETARHCLEDYGVSYHDMGVELSAPSRGVMLWAMMMEIGLEGIVARIRRHNDMAQLMAKLIKEHPNLELLQEPTLSVCCFRYVDSEVNDLEAMNREIHSRLILEDEHMPSTTVVDGKLAIRPCFIGARTVEAHATGLLDAVARLGAAVSSEIP